LLANFQSVVNAVEAFYNQQFSNTVTINVTFDWQALNVGYVSGPFTLGSNNYATSTASYADIRNVLINHLSTNDANPGDDAAMTGALPVTDPGVATTGNTVQWNVSNVQEKLLGLNGVGPNDNLGADATITLASDLPNGTSFDFNRADGIGANAFDAFGVLAHEISEGLMGRFMDGGAQFKDKMGNLTPFNNYSIMDLLHFTPSGTRAIVQPAAGGNILSFDGNTKDPNLNRVLDNNGDIADPSNTADPRNSFADGQTGVINAITQTDLRILDVLGWTRINGLDDHNQSNTAATTVLNANTATGNGINGSIEVQGDHDWFKVVLDPAKHYAISVEGTATGKGTLADPFVALYGGANPSRDTSAPIETADDGGVGTNSMLLTGFGNNGNFFVDVGSIGTAPESVVGKVQDIGTGTYRVTLFGNAPPVLSADTGSPHALSELPGVTNSNTPDQVPSTPPATLSFTDPDAGDTHTASENFISATWSGGATIPAATLTALESALTDSISAESSPTTAGTLAWTFSLQDHFVDFLALNETLTVVHDVTVTNHQAGSPLGDSSTQHVTIVFTGTNDPPVVNAAQSTLTGSISEQPNVTGSLTPETTPPSAIAFSDPDLNDRPTADPINPADQTLTWQDATHDYTSELTAAQIAAFKAAFTISAEAGNTNTGKIDWNYSIIDKQLDFLGDGETITVTTPVVIDDHNGGAVTQDIVVTIHGANDPPIATPDSNGTPKNSTLTVSALDGVLANDTDPDTHDQGHLVVGAVDGSAANVGHPIAGTYGSLTLNADGSYVYVANQGSLPAQIVAQDIFNYTVADPHGGTDLSTLSIVVFNPGVSYLAGINTTLNGGNGPDVVDGSAGHDTLFGGNGPDVLIGGNGDTLTGGNGPDTLLFRPNFGANTIKDFDVHNDVIQFDKSIFSSVADMLANHTKNTSGGAVITDANGDTITLVGVTVAQLEANASSFHLV
jgi:VCBS repeat-containing protein